MAGKDNQTIIIKKIKKGGHGHHGGAWKVAYADFVTAMMAFFLLLWLLSSTPVENLKGLADYFTPTIGLQGKMGVGFRGGLAPNHEGVSAGDWASQGMVFGTPPSGPIVDLPDTKDNRIEEEHQPGIFVKPKPEEEVESLEETYDTSTEFSQVEQDIKAMVNETAAVEQFRDNILIEQTPEGLKIHIFDKKDRSMFEGQSPKLSVHAKTILGRIADIIRFIPNYVQISGHTSSTFKPKSENYGHWELSSDRANSAQRHMVVSGMDDEQIARVVGKADHEPFDIQDPDSEKNSRITITLLRQSILGDHKKPAPEEILLHADDEGLEQYLKDEKARKVRLKKLERQQRQRRSGEPIINLPEEIGGEEDAAIQEKEGAEVKPNSKGQGSGVVVDEKEKIKIEVKEN